MNKQMTCLIEPATCQWHLTSAQVGRKCRLILFAAFKIDLAPFAKYQV